MTITTGDSLTKIEVVVMTGIASDEALREGLHGEKGRVVSDRAMGVEGERERASRQVDSSAFDFKVDSR